MNLHSLILDIQDRVDPRAAVGDSWLRGYQHGHRAARIDAADIALQSTAVTEEAKQSAYAEGRKDEREASCVDELVAALRGLMEIEARGRIMPIGREWDAARAVLAKLEQTK